MQLLELGAVELVELGVVGPLRSVPAKSPIIELFRFVDTLENPLADIEFDPGEGLDPRQVAVAKRLHTISRMTRKNLLQNRGLSGTALEGWDLESVRLLGVLNDLGKLKKIGKKIKKVGKKIGKVVKSPAFLGVVGLAANFIPGVGKVASAALTSASAAMAKKQAEKKQEKAEAKAIAQQQAEIAAQEAAMAEAMKQAFPQLPGDGLDLNTLPPDVLAQMQGLTPQYAQQISAVGKDNFLATALKAIGQSGALANFTRGLGLPGGLSEQMNTMFEKIQGSTDPAIQKALAAGEQDLLNDAAAVGASDTVGRVMNQGKPGFPILEVGIAAGVLVVFTTALVLSTS